MCCFSVGRTLGGASRLYRPKAFSAAGQLNSTFLIYLPLRNAPATLTVGLDSMRSFICGPACSADTAPPFKAPPVVFYWGDPPPPRPPTRS